MATQTIGVSGTRTDINAWVANLQTIDPFSDIQEGLVTSGGVTTGSGQVVSGFDENGHGWVLRPNTASGFRDHADADTNPQFYDNTKGAFVEKTSTQATVIDASVTNGLISGLQAKKNDSGYNDVIHISSSGAFVDIEDCIVHLSTGARAITQRAGDIRRTLVVCEEGDGILLSSGGGELDRVNVRRLNGPGGTGITQDYGTWSGTNVVVSGFSTDMTGTMSGSHCATDQAAGGLPSTNRQTSLVAATEWESATADFRLASGSAKLKDNGTGSDNDIVGQAPDGTVDIGQWEFQSGGGVTHYTITADAGTYTLTGVAAGLRAARKIAGAQGTYALTGVAAGLRAGRKIAGATGTYALSGVDAGLKATRTLTADAGAYTLTGQDATLTEAGAYTLIAEAGAYTLTGVDAGLLATRQLAADAGAYTMTGFDAGLSVGTGTATQPTGGGFIPPQLLRQVERKRRRTAEQREQVERAEVRAREDRIALLRSTYDRAQGIAPTESTQAAVQAVAEIVRDYAQASDTALPPLPAIDWQMLAKQIDVTEKLALAVDRLLMVQAEEDEAIATLLLMLAQE
jgi:hypothetical protein